MRSLSAKLVFVVYCLLKENLARDCGKPSQPEFTAYDPIKEYYKENSSIIYSCPDKNDKIFGGSELVCKDGEWKGNEMTSEIPRCAKQDFPAVRLKRVQNGFYYPQRYFQHDHDAYAAFKAKNWPNDCILKYVESNHNFFTWELPLTKFSVINYITIVVNSTANFNVWNKTIATIIGTRTQLHYNISQKPIIN